MKYEKGTKLEYDNKHYYYIDEFDSDEDGLILICGGGGYGLVQYLSDNEVTMIDSSIENKTMDILVDIALSLKMLNQNIDEMAGSDNDHDFEEIDDDNSNSEIELN